MCVSTSLLIETNVSATALSSSVSHTIFSAWRKLFHGLFFPLIFKAFKPARTVSPTLVHRSQRAAKAWSPWLSDFEPSFGRELRSLLIRLMRSLVVSSNTLCSNNAPSGDRYNLQPLETILLAKSTNWTTVPATDNAVIGSIFFNHIFGEVEV
jgi:hypothetical protein